MPIAGLTGGIATGKSTVAAMLQAAGAVIIDADVIAHAVIRQGRPAWGRIVEHFGPDVLLPEGEIDRGRLGDIIFKDARQKEVLNGIVHPEVFREMEAQIRAAASDRPGAVIILDVPLLIETGMQAALNTVILVYSPEAVQIQRLMARDHLSATDALARVRSQMPIEEKRRLAGIIIDNSGTIAATRARTLEVYQRLNAG